MSNSHTRDRLLLDDHVDLPSLNNDTAHLKSHHPKDTYFSLKVKYAHRTDTETLLQSLAQGRKTDDEKDDDSQKMRG